MALFPVASEQPTTRPAFANLTLIGLNFFMFLIEIILGDSFVNTWAFTPAHLTAFFNGTGSFQAVLTIFTAMFMHGSFSHIFGNMLFLWVFGQATENAFGSRMYTTFYLVCGVAANMAQYLVDPNSSVPNLGASGAIAGVMGAYFVLYPQSRVLTLIPLIIFWEIVELPAIMLLGFWFLMQLFSAGAIAVTASTGGGSGGVAFMAHVAGFVVGMIGVLVFRKRQRPEPWSY